MRLYIRLQPCRWMRLTKSISYSKDHDMVAQQLYEGINIGSGVQGLITCHAYRLRARISPVAQKNEAAKNYINDRLVASIPKHGSVRKCLRCSRCPRPFVHLASLTHQKASLSMDKDQLKLYTHLEPFCG